MSLLASPSPRLRSTPLAIVLFLAILASSATVRAQTYLGNHPSGELPWSDNLQGLAHDSGHWFITQPHRIWRIPVGVDLARTNLPSSVTTLGLNSHTGRYDHFGGPHYIEISGLGYLLVPLEGKDDGLCGRLAVYRVREDGLSFTTSVCLPGQGTTAAWLAVDPDGLLYSAPFDIGVSQGVNRFRIDWEALVTRATCWTSPGPTEPCALDDLIEALPALPLYDTAGERMRLVDVQGGVFSPEGGLLILVSDEQGIHVFSRATQTGGERLSLIDRSCNASPTHACPFAFQFIGDLGSYQEPEGIDFWDLNDGRAPGIRGEIHVAMIQNELDQDDAWIKHYTTIQRVDPAAASAGLGSESAPYRNVQAALDRAWPISRIQLRGGRAYAPSNTSLLDTPVMLDAWGGVATLGP